MYAIKTRIKEIKRHLRTSTPFRCTKNKTLVKYNKDFLILQQFVKKYGADGQQVIMDMADFGFSASEIANKIGSSLKKRRLRHARNFND